MHEWGESIRWVRPTCPGGRERVRYTERLARSMGSDDDMFRIWSGPEGSSHKEPLSGIRIHRVRRRFLVPRQPARAGRAFGVSLVLGFACGIARLPNALPALAGCRPKPPEGSHLSDNLIPCLMLLVGVIWSAVAMWFKGWRRCRLFLQVKRSVCERASTTEDAMFALTT